MSTQSPIWQYFTRNESTAECKICNKILSLGHSLPKKQTTSNIKSHFEKLHNEEYQKFTQMVAALEEKEKLIQVWADDFPISKRIDKAIMDLILVDMLPFSVVEGEAFKRLNFGNPNAISKYQLKSEEFFRTTMVPATYEAVKEKVETFISKTKWMSLTTDIWTDPAKTWMLLILSAHFIKGARRPSIVLGEVLLETDATGAQIAQKLGELVDEYGINEKVHLIVSSNAPNMTVSSSTANMTVSGTIGSMKYLNCIAHILQLVVQDAIFFDTNVNQLILKSRKLVGHFNNEQALTYLKQYQDICGLPHQFLLTDESATWTSTYLMFDWLLKQERAIHLYLAHSADTEALAKKDWDLMSNIVTVLKVFYQAHVEISDHLSCVSIILPLVVMLRSYLLLESGDPQEIVTLKTRLNSSILHRFAFVQATPELILATLLDPRFKAKYFLEHEVKHCEDMIFEHLQHTAAKKEKCKKKDMKKTKDGKKTREHKLRKHNNDDLWQTHDEDMQKTFNELEGPLHKTQLMGYLSEPLLARNANIFEYWKATPYDCLKKAANKYLSAPPSSVGSEELFRAADQLYNGSHSNGCPANSNLVFLNANIKFFKFDY